MSRPSPVPCPIGLVVKNGSKIRSRICAGMPAPLSMTRTTTCSILAARRHLDAARVGDGIEGIVDQVRPDLVEFAGEAAHARQAGFRFHHHGGRFCPRLRSEDGDRVAQTLDQVHRFGNRCLIHVREAFDRGRPGPRCAWRRPESPMRGCGRNTRTRPTAARRSTPAHRWPAPGCRAPRTSRRYPRAVPRWRCRGRGRRASRPWPPRVRPAQWATARRPPVSPGKPRERHRRPRVAPRSAWTAPSARVARSLPPAGPRAARRCVRSRRRGCSTREPVPRTVSRGRPSSRRAGRSR